MPRERYVFKWDPEKKEVVRINLDPPAELHYVQDDTIPPTVSHATPEGKVFTSRSALYEHYRQHGFEVTGGDHLTGKGVADYKYKCDVQDLRNDIAESIRKIKWGMAPTNEREKEVCNREEREYRSYSREARMLDKLRNR